MGIWRLKGTPAPLYRGVKNVKMNIEFKCKTNYEDPYINVLNITLKSGAKVTIDRPTTLYSVENGVMSMTWEDSYIYALDDAHFFGGEDEYGLRLFDIEKDEFKKLVSGCKAEFEIEDEAPQDYTCELISFEVK